jgi:hypothetical protein
MKHGWNSWDNYWDIHEKILRIYSKYMQAPKTYKLEKHTAQFYELSCEGIMITTFKQTLVRVDIRKEVEIDDSSPNRLRARTIGYSYSVNLPNPDGRNLIRYCSPHIDHNKFHHKHDFTKKPPQTIRIGDDEYPHVGEFLNEVLANF